MLLRGTLQGVLRDLKDNMIISFNVGQNVPDAATIEGKELDIKVTQHREKRTLTQNAYYWALLSKLAGKLFISVPRAHNQMLRDVAPPFIMDGKMVMQAIPNTEKADNDVCESETFHLRPTTGMITGNDGCLYRWYVVLRGSSTFDTAEMTVLLNRLIEECKEQGIETLPPDELERMRLYSLEQERRK